MKIVSTVRVSLKGLTGNKLRTFFMMLGGLTGTSQTLTIFLSIVAGLSLLVGGFIVMNIMLISVSERTKEIGLRRAVGARRRDILLQFVLEAISLSLGGGLVGILAGATSGVVLGRVTGWPTAISPFAILLAFGVSAVVGIFFGAYPARRAARLDPIVALRAE
jgi:ABC-type antimicrobial peptide transport system permease subunit